MLIDLRSDTITRPTPEMQAAMWEARVGDDVFGEDPTVNALEEKMARLFGMEAALFCVSGTMANQLAIRAHTLPGTEVICDRNSHIYLYEGGGIMTNSLASVKLLEGDYGRLNAAQVEAAITGDTDLHAPVTTLVSLENTMNKGGGVCYDFRELEAIAAVCRTKQVALHLDGARLFNALVVTGESPQRYGALFDTIAVCLSKGLGCPVGSVLLGSSQAVRKARRFRKAMGGGWRQAGFLAAAGLYALEHHIDRLREDHRRAAVIGDVLRKQRGIRAVYPVQTNIVIAQLEEGISEVVYLRQLEEKQIRAVAFGKGLVRFVTHLDCTETHLEAFCERIKTMPW